MGASYRVIVIWADVTAIWCGSEGLLLAECGLTLSDLHHTRRGGGRLSRSLPWPLPRGGVIDPRGELLDKNNIQERLTMRNFMETLRNIGVETGGPAALSTVDKQAFANQLDRLLAKIR